MEYENLRLEIDGGVACVTLDRPKAANALNLALATELADAALRCDEDPAVRAILLTGAGPAFCAGGDLRSFAAVGDAAPALLKQITAQLHAAISRFTRGDAPLVIAVNGVAAGAGMSLVCSADLAIAAESARFTMAYTRAGLAPDGSSTFFLPRLCGTRRTAELMLTNRMLSAAEAAEWGLVNRVVADDVLPGDARALADQLAAGPTRAFGAVKALLQASADSGLETQMEHEARAIADMARSADGREGIAAFLEKRDAHFEGR